MRHMLTADTSCVVSALERSLGECVVCCFKWKISIPQESTRPVRHRLVQ